MQFWYITLLVLACVFLILGILMDCLQRKYEKQEIEQTITQTLRIRDINPVKKKKGPVNENTGPVIIKSELLEESLELYDDEKI